MPTATTLSPEPHAAHSSPAGSHQPSWLGFREQPPPAQVIPGGREGGFWAFLTAGAL